MSNRKGVIIFIAFVWVAVLAACSTPPASTPATATAPAAALESVPDSNVSDAYPQGNPAYPDIAYGAPQNAYGSPEGADDPLILKKLEVDAYPLFDGKLLFHSNRTGIIQTFSLDGQTGELGLVSPEGLEAFEPAWSNNCSQIAFSSGTKHGSDFEIYTMASAAKEATLLFSVPDNLNWAPAWTDDGSYILYTHNQDARINICVYNIGNGNHLCMPHGDFNNGRADVSPDGTRITFASTRDGDWEIYTMPFDPVAFDQEMPVTRLTFNPQSDLRPRYSPDGTRIVFDSAQTGSGNIHVINADGTNPVQLTDSGAPDYSASWLDNERIIFTSVQVEELEGDLFIVQADGTNMQRLTASIGHDQGAIACSAP